MIYVLILAGLYWLVRDITRMIRRKVKKGAPGRWGRFLLSMVGAFLLVFMIGSGINYNRDTFADEYHMDLSGGTAEDLYYLSEIMLENANVLALQMDRNQEGVMQLSFRVRERCRAAMLKLSESYASLDGFYPLPKAVLFSEYMSHEHITGIMSPFTMEAQYNDRITPYNIPHVICHELAHLKGYSREDEANFIGLLACFGSEDPDIRYSGYMLGYVYTSNALYGADYDAWMRLRESISDPVELDLGENNRYWDRYQTKLAEVREKINDVQLKINHQSDGVKSYGRVVDLLLSYYRTEIEARKGTP